MRALHGARHGDPTEQPENFPIESAGFGPQLRGKVVDPLCFAVSIAELKDAPVSL